jgi:GntR family transcriptional regulator
MPGILPRAVGQATAEVDDDDVRLVVYELMTSSRFAQIAADVRERIALGELGPDGAVESEAELCRRYQVSRPTVRRALEMLRQQGLVEPRHGAGWFVTGSAFHQRLALGTFRHAGSVIAEAGKTVVRRVVDFGYVAAPSALAVALGVDPESDVLLARSVRTVDDDPLDVVDEWVPAELAGRISRADASSPGIWATLARHGDRVATVRQTITAGVASERDARLLAVDAGSPLLLVRRLAIGANGKPLALSDHRYLAHRFALEVEFNSGPGTSSYEAPGLRAVHHDQLEEKSA